MGTEPRLEVESGEGARARDTRSVHLFLRLLLSVGLLAVGGAGGWALHDWTGHSDRPVEVTVEARAADSGAGTDVAAVSMPDLTGLDEADARLALAAIGAGPDRVRVELVPAAGEPGLVVGQDPAAARPVPDDGQVALRLAQSTAVPDLRGRDEEGARRELIALGARVTREETYAPDAAAGQVVETSPAAGTALTEDVVLIVAQSPSSVFLDALDPVTNECSSGTATVSGTPYSHAFTCSTGTEPRVIDFTLGRLTGRFEAVFGIDDRSSPGRPATLQVIVDGRSVLTSSASFGESIPVSVDTRGALRLRLELTVAAGPDGSSSSARAVLADARLVGAPSDIDALTAESTN